MRRKYYYQIDFKDFLHKTQIEMRPLSKGVHVGQIEYPHVAQRQRVLVKQPIPHHFVALHLAVRTKRLRIHRRYPVTKHSVQLGRELGQRKHVPVSNGVNETRIIDSIAPDAFSK